MEPPVWWNTQQASKHAAGWAGEPERIEGWEKIREKEQERAVVKEQIKRQGRPG
jgi:hypothetical protein